MEQMAKRTVLEEAQPTLRYSGGVDGNMRLTHSTAGHELAGSGVRWTEEKWGALFTATNGTTGGRWFRTESEARAVFELWTEED